MSIIPFYLKANKFAPWSVRCALHWIEAARLVPEAKIIILCDNPTLKAELLKKTDLEETDFLESNRTDASLKKIVDGIIDPFWIKAGYAHLTTFLDAEKQGYSDFWNIDADDTYPCVSPERLAEILVKTRADATEKHIGITSLDMWYTALYGFHWTFGVTYTRTDCGWIEMMLRHVNDEAYKTYKPTIRLSNVDKYFTYLKDKEVTVRFGIFCVENMKFIYYADDMFYKFFGSGFYHWKDGILYQPLLLSCAGSVTEGVKKIPNDVIIIDVGLTDSENLVAMFSDSNYDPSRLQMALSSPLINYYPEAAFTRFSGVASQKESGPGQFEELRSLRLRNAELEMQLHSLRQKNQEQEKTLRGLNDLETHCFANKAVRKVKGGVRCLKEHGPAYTAQRFVFHLNRYINYLQSK